MTPAIQALVDAVKLWKREGGALPPPIFDAVLVVLAEEAPEGAPSMANKPAAVPLDVRAALAARAEIVAYLKTRAARLDKDGKPDSKGWINGGERSVNSVCCTVADEIARGEAAGALLAPSLPDYLRPGVIVDPRLVWYANGLASEVIRAMSNAELGPSPDELRDRANDLKSMCSGFAFTAQPRIEEPTE